MLGVHQRQANLLKQEGNDSGKEGGGGVSKARKGLCEGTVPWKQAI